MESIYIHLDLSIKERAQDGAYCIRLVSYKHYTGNYRHCTVLFGLNSDSDPRISFNIVLIK